MKKKQLFGLILLMLITLFIPNNINAKEKKVICEYQYKNQELIYTIDNKVILPFEDGKDNWYHGQDFKNNYLNNSKINSNTYVCPTITIEESDSFITVFNNPRSEDECNGVCTTLSAINYRSSKNINVKKAVDTTAISSVGIYNQDNYFIPYFRLLEDGTKEWSVDGINYKPVTEKVENDKLEISLDKSLIEEIYQDKNLNKNVTIYRNVKKDNNKYVYLLATNKVSGYNLNDGQETSARAYHAAYGEPEMDEWLEDYNQNQDCSGDNSILGSYNDPNSVAYFLQIIFNWLKLIGPFIVIVMSGIDFAKVIIMGDDDGMKKAQTKLIIRLILAACLFFLPDLIKAFLDLFNITSSGICGLQ